MLLNPLRAKYQAVARYGDPPIQCLTGRLSAPLRRVYSVGDRFSSSQENLSDLVSWSRKMTDIKRVSLAVLAPLMIISMPLAGLAEDAVIKRTTVIESTSKVSPGAPSSVSITATKTYTLKFKERLSNITQQNATALSKGWITADEKAKFDSEIERLTAVEAKVEGAGFPKADVDDLEKQVTKLNADLSSASNKAKTTATTSTTTTTAKKTAAGDTKAKPKTKTTTKTTTSTKK